MMFATVVLYMSFTFRMRHFWINTLKNMFLIFMLESCWCFISLSESITEPLWIIFTIPLSFKSMHGTTQNMSWCWSWWVRVFVDLIIVSFRIIVLQRLIWPGPKELLSIRFLKITLNENGWFLCLFMAKKPYTFPWSSRSPLNGKTNTAWFILMHRKLWWG